MLAFQNSSTNSCISYFSMSLAAKAIMNLFFSVLQAGRGCVTHCYFNFHFQSSSEFEYLFIQFCEYSIFLGLFIYILQPHVYYFCFLPFWSTCIIFQIETLLSASLQIFFKHLSDNFAYAHFKILIQTNRYVFSSV